MTKVDILSAMTGWMLFGGMLRMLAWAESPVMALCVGVGVLVLLIKRLTEPK